MHSGDDTIKITVVVAGATHELSTRQGEYRSLMALIYDRMYVDGFGECRGMGRCGTCRVCVDGDPVSLTGMDRNELATLAKLGEDTAPIRLACQLLIDEQLHHRTVTVLYEG